MVRLWRFLTNPFCLLLIIFLTQFAVYLFISYRPFYIAPEGHTYTVIGRNYFYPNMILQAKDGAWSILDTNTTRPTPRAYVWLFFVFLGKIAALLHIDQITTYQLSQMVGGLLMFFTSFWLIHLILPSSVRRLAVIFVLLGETGPLITTTANKFLDWMPSFPSHVSFERHFGLPHHTWGEALGLLFIGLLWKSTKKLTLLRAILLFVTAAIATTVLPPYMVTFGITAMAIWFVWALAKRQFHTTIVPLTISALGICISGIIVKLEFAKGIPWNVFQSAEKSWWSTEKLVTEYGSSLLLYYPLIILLGIMAVIKWKSWTPSMKLVVLTMTAWVFGPFLYIPIAKETWFPVANFRMTDGYQYFPAGVLAAIAVHDLSRIVRHQAVKRIVLGGVIGTWIVISVALTGVFTRQIMASQYNFWANIYPAKTTMEAVFFMNTVPKYSGIMVREFFGEVIQAFANVRVFIGGPHGFPDWGERHWLTQRFFSGELSVDEAGKIIRENDIDYVFYGPDERSLTTTTTFYSSLLEPIFTNPTVTVYKVKE